MYAQVTRAIGKVHQERALKKTRQTTFFFLYLVSHPLCVCVCFFKLICFVSIVVSTNASSWNASNSKTETAENATENDVSANETNENGSQPFCLFEHYRWTLNQSRLCICVSKHIFFWGRCNTSKCPGKNENNFNTVRQSRRLKGILFVHFIYLNGSRHKNIYGSSFFGERKNSSAEKKTALWISFRFRERKSNIQYMITLKKMLMNKVVYRFISHFTYWRAGSEEFTFYFESNPHSIHEIYDWKWKIKIFLMFRYVQ